MWLSLILSMHTKLFFSSSWFISLQVHWMNISFFLFRFSLVLNVEAISILQWRCIEMFYIAGLHKPSWNTHFPCHWLTQVLLIHTFSVPVLAGQLLWHSVSYSPVLNHLTQAPTVLCVDGFLSYLLFMIKDEYRNSLPRLSFLNFIYFLHSVLFPFERGI